MKIIHLTDFHYRPDDNFQYDQNKLINSLVAILQKVGKIDFLFFTGDLVNTGKNSEDFFEAYLILIERIKDILSLKDEQIFICGGNHDVFRGQEISALNLKIEGFTSNIELDNFVKNETDREFIESLMNHKNFIELQKNIYSKALVKHDDIIHPLYTVHKRELNSKSIGVASIYTAWRSYDSTKDRGNLLYPISFMKKIVESIKECDFKILLMHHPISDFKDFNSSVLEDLIFQNFHLLFSGHVHKKKQSTHVTSDEGIFCCVSPAALSLFDNYSQIGFTKLDVDVETFEISFANYSYIKSDEIFISLPEQKVDIPLNHVKQEQNELRKTFRKRYKEELIYANDLFINTNEKDSKNSFLDLFTNPILKAKSKTEIASSNTEAHAVSFEDISSSKISYLIFGKDKSGKTSLLKKIQLELLKGFSNNKIIPFYVDCKDNKNLKKPYDFIGSLSQYYEINRRKVEDLLKTYHLVLLIDNYDSGIEFFNEPFITFLEAHANVSFIGCAEETLSRSYDSIKLGERNHSTLFIHAISRKEVRQLANKWPNLTEEKKEYVLEKITQIFYQLNIPLNYWTVSLFFWVYEKNSDVNINNNFDLIQLYIDGLLDRNKMAFDKNSKINFEDFKIFIGELSYYMFKNFHINSYGAEYADLINFARDYRNKNKKFVISVEEIISILIDKGIIKKRGDSRYSFRLNGVFEYFLAFYMKDNQSFRDEVISDNHFYLSFSNELELCSGFNRRDEFLINQIFEKTKEILKEVNERYKLNGGADRNLLLKISEVFDMSIPINQISNGKELTLSPESQDRLLEDTNPIEIQRAEVERKKFYESIESNSENIEKALFILSRVYRNSSLSNEGLDNSVLDFILESACNLGFLLIDETSEKGFKHVDVTNDKEEELLMKLVTNFMPLIVQTFLFDALAQNNLERIIQEKIDELKVDSKNNQFKLMLLYYLIIDLNVKANRGKLKEVIETITLGALQQTTLIKLFTYLVFKSYGNPVFEKFVIDLIDKQQLLINPKYDKGKFHQSLEKQKKLILLKGKI